MAIRHRMGDIAKTLLTYTADVTVRGHPPCGSVEDGNLGPTVTDLASNDRALHSLLRAHQMSHTANHKSSYLQHNQRFSQERAGLLTLLGGKFQGASGLIDTVGLLFPDIQIIHNPKCISHLYFAKLSGLRGSVAVS